MDFPFGSEYSGVFVTNVGLITSDGPMGPDIMACEWTHHISYKPGLIAICIHTTDTTYLNIHPTKEFGVNIAASDQNVLSSIAGGSHGKNVDKIGILKELGFKFYQAKTASVLMVEGAALNAECRLIEERPHGDHIMAIGEVVEASVNPEKTPIVYHNGKYWKFGEQIMKPPQDVLDKIARLREKYKKT